jgi:SsrA-binding protein
MRINNRRARFDYEVVEELEAGLILTGAEAKSFRGGRTQLEGSFVTIRSSPESGLPEAWLVNANIPLYEHSWDENYDSRQSRKLLLHRRELFRLEQKLKEGRLTIVPLAMYTTGRLVKLKIALARGRKTWQKRELLRKRDLQREVEREAGNRR